MPIVTRCRGCLRKARIASDSAGRIVRCSGCGATFPVSLGTGELTVEWGPFGIGKRFPLMPEEKVTVGRGRDCTIQLLAPLVSRRHLGLIWNGFEWRLRDLGSSNGTYVNEQRVDEIGLTDGSRIGVGDFALRLTVARNRPSEPGTVLDAMALGESRAGMIAIVEPPENESAVNPLAETLVGQRVIREETSVRPGRATSLPPEARPRHNAKWIAVSVLIALAAAAVLLAVAALR